MEDIIKVSVTGTEIEEYINHGRPSRCKFCKARIWFVRNNGKTIPISEEVIAESGDTYFVKHFDSCAKS